MIPATTEAQGNCEVDCREALKAADKLIDMKNKIILNQTIQIDTYEAYSRESINLIQKQQTDLDKWYRKPEVTIPGSIVLGIVLGFFASSRLK